MNARANARSVLWAQVFGGQTKYLRIFVKEFVFPVIKKCFETRALDRLLYSVADAAVLLSCSKNTVYSFIKSGQLAAVYPTSKTRVSAAALLRFVELKEEEAQSERAAQRRMVQ
jgi:excisionase family DNA binding protein